MRTVPCAVPHASLFSLRRAFGSVAYTLAAYMLAACGPRPFVSATPPAPITEAPVRPIPEPSPLLVLTRSERLLSETALTPTTIRGNAEGLPTLTEALGDEASDAEDESDDETDDEPGEARIVVVHSSRFATPEDLARAAVRSVEPRRPRLLNETRLLLRASGLARPCSSCGADGNEARAAARALLSATRPRIKACLIGALADQPEIVVKAPAGLVLEQAMTSEPVVYRFTVHFGPESEPPKVADPDGVLDHGVRECIVDVVQSQIPAQSFPAASIPLVAFSQRAAMISGGAMNSMLAREAATLGWLHYERGEYTDALAYFDDAYWVFHLVEYQMLRGLALEALGRHVAAVEAYGMYVDERRHAPEVPQLKEKIATLSARQAAARPRAE